MLGDEGAPSSSMHSGSSRIDDLGAVLGHPFVAAGEVLRLADHHRADLELADEAAAVPAGRKGGHHHAVGVVPTPPGVAECGRLGVDRGIVVLDAPVVAAPEQRPVAVEEGGADGDAALGQTRAAPLRVRRAGSARACASVSGSFADTERSGESLGHDRRSYLQGHGREPGGRPAPGAPLRRPDHRPSDQRGPRRRLLRGGGAGAGRSHAPGCSPRSWSRWPPWAFRWP